MEIFVTPYQFIAHEKRAEEETTASVISSNGARKGKKLSTDRMLSVQLLYRGRKKKERYMKLSKLSFTVLAVLFATRVFAQDDNKGKLALPEAVTVQGNQLSPGDYKLQWDGSGPNVELKILKGKETVATVPARIVPEQKKNAVNSYGVTKQQDGTRALTAIYFGGKNFNLEIVQDSAQATPPGSTAAR
jgi:hypothetical protein